MSDLTLDISSIYQRIGRVKFEHNTPSFQSWWTVGANHPVLAGDRAIATLVWGDDWLDVKVSTQNESFVRGLGKFSELWTKVSGRPPKDLQRLSNYQICSGLVRPNDHLKFQFIIDTDSESFCKLAGRHLQADQVSLTVKLGLHLYQFPEDKDRNRAVRPDTRRISLSLSPLQYPPPYKGFVAIDLGNTNTTLAAIDLVGSLNSESCGICPDIDYTLPFQAWEFSSDGGPVPSVIRINAVARWDDPEVRKLAGAQTAEELQMFPESYHFYTGASTAPEAGPEGLVISPKRLLASEEEGKTCIIDTRFDRRFPPQLDSKEPADSRVLLRSNIPSLLFLCRLFQVFRACKRSYPNRLVATYPTSYSRSELIKTRRAVYQAWCMGERHSPFLTPPEEELVSLTLDEATAAAFYYFTQRVFDAPGGLHGFRWLFPRGFYLLVYDCGGATVDISLVHAYCSASDCLSFKVLGRTGLRDFGGDDITVATFLWLKTKLAVQLAELLKRSQDSVTWKKGLATNPLRFLASEDILRSVDDLVPTDFDRESADISTRFRKELTLRMWKWAENVKRRIAQGQAIDGLLADHEWIAKLLVEHRHPSLSEAQLRDALRKVQLARQEIDAVVEPVVKRSIDACKKLLQAKLSERAGLLDDVFVIGNGSLYPLIGELVRTYLLGDEPTGSAMWSDNSTMNHNDLKNAVAKGAVLALTMKEAGLGIRLEFDAELSERLPYSVGWRNTATRSDVLLFEEGQHFRDLKPQTIEIPPQQDDRRTQWIKLSQRWPGGDYEPFLVFHFPNGVEGRVIIEFDPDAEQFFASCPETGERVVGKRDINTSIYLAPPQRGKIRLSEVL